MPNYASVIVLNGKPHIHISVNGEEKNLPFEGTVEQARVEAAEWSAYLGASGKK